MITYEQWDLTMSAQPNFSADSPTKGAYEALSWAYEAYGEKLVYACSFGIEGIVLIDLISKIKPDAEIVFLDTGYHFKETYEVIEKVKRRYPALQIQLHSSELSLEEQAAQYGQDLWQSSPNQCCHLRKIVPLTKALEPATAWISGLRREQSETRKHTQFINQDKKFKKIKVCPLIHWSWKDVWRYVSKHELDYNSLHDQGYPSIGCETCTKPAFTADDFRSGRWSGSGKTECGLHAD